MNVGVENRERRNIYICKLVETIENVIDLGTLKKDCIYISNSPRVHINTPVCIYICSFMKKSIFLQKKIAKELDTFLSKFPFNPNDPEGTEQLRTDIYKNR